MDTGISIDQVIAAARAGGAVVQKYFGQLLAVEQKSNAGDLRTQADTESEQAIIAALGAAYPSVNIFAEESGYMTKGSEYTFVIDPLDGTNNFVLGIPDFAISIGLLHGDRVMMGVIYNPILDQLYQAELGKGAMLNGQPIHVNQEADFAKATISYTSGYNTPREYSEHVVAQLKDRHAKRVLDHWAPAYDYCLLASGRIEAVISREGDFEDYVAAKIIVAEAGGIITDFAGGPVGGRTADFIASNGTALHNDLLAVMSKA